MREGLASQGVLSSAFAGRIAGYIEYKRELGYKATTAEVFYGPSFDRFCRESRPDEDVLNEELILGWVREAGGKCGRSGRASFMRELARYCIEEGDSAYLIPLKMFPADKPRTMPHLFTQEELDAFFAVADSLPPSNGSPVRHLIAPVLFRLMYCTGLRPKEARELPVERFDLDSGVIHIVDSKDRRDRDVPVSADLASLCRAYSEAMEAVFPGREAFFPHESGVGCLPNYTAARYFRMCRDEAGLAGFAGPKPCQYSFRHTFATNTIRRWRADGVDVEGNLRFLQEYMGHADLEGTLYYIHLVRGGLGDPTRIPTWDPVNRAKMQEDWFYVEV